MKAAESDTIQESIALYGGSFDPVHSAHLEIARKAQHALKLDKVVFLPAAASPLKQSSMQADSDARLEMLRLATEKEASFQIDTREIERGGTSYTIDTVHSIQTDHPSAKLFWIMGGDQFQLLPEWRNVEQLSHLLTFIVFKRPGFPLNRPDLANLSFVEIEAPLMEQSSSLIRARLTQGEAVGDWLPASVEAFISEHRLYTKQEQHFK